jgi:hypothetical protein
VCYIRAYVYFSHLAYNHAYAHKYTHTYIYMLSHTHTHSVFDADVASDDLIGETELEVKYLLTTPGLQWVTLEGDGMYVCMLM